MPGKWILSFQCSWHVPTRFQRPSPPVGVLAGDWKGERVSREPGPCGRWSGNLNLGSNDWSASRIGTSGWSGWRLTRGTRRSSGSWRTGLRWTLWLSRRRTRVWGSWCGRTGGPFMVCRLAWRWWRPIWLYCLLGCLPWLRLRWWIWWGRSQGSVGARDSNPTEEPVSSSVEHGGVGGGGGIGEELGVPKQGGDHRGRLYSYWSAICLSWLVDRPQW